MIVSVLLLSLALQCTQGAPAPEVALKEVVRKFDTQQLHDFAQIIFQQKLEEDEAAEERSNAESDEDDTYMVTEAPVARELLPEPMVGELGVLKELRQLSDEMERNRDRLEELIGRLEGGGSSRDVRSAGTAEQDSFMRRTHRLVRDLDRKQYSSQQKAAMLEEMSSMIEENKPLHRSKRSAFLPNVEFPEMATMGSEPLQRVRRAAMEEYQEMTTMGMPVRRRRSLSGDEGQADIVDEEAEALVVKLDDLLGQLRQLQ